MADKNLMFPILLRPKSDLQLVPIKSYSNFGPKFCQPLRISTKTIDVKKLVDNFLRGNDLLGDLICAICSNRAPATLGRKSGFGALAKANALHITVMHCVLHRHTLATKTFPAKLAEV